MADAGQTDQMLLNLATKGVIDEGLEFILKPVSPDKLLSR
jgi:hypothetical protein